MCFRTILRTRSKETVIFFRGQLKLDYVLNFQRYKTVKSHRRVVINIKAMYLGWINNLSGNNTNIKNSGVKIKMDEIPVTVYPGIEPRSESSHFSTVRHLKTWSNLSSFHWFLSYVCKLIFSWTARHGCTRTNSFSYVQLGEEWQSISATLYI